VDLERGERFGFLGFEFRYLRGLSGAMRPHYTPKPKLRPKPARQSSTLPVGGRGGNIPTYPAPKSADLIGTFDDFNVEMRQNFCMRFRKFWSWISAVGEERLQKWGHAEQCSHDENASEPA